MTLLRALLQLMLWPLPWFVRRPLLNLQPGWRVAKDARIGWSVLLARSVELAPKARIGHFNVARSLSVLCLDEGALIGNLNWITGYPEGGKDYFADEPDRKPGLWIGREAAVTHRHMIDCANRVTIGAYSTVAGWRSQILSHGIDFSDSRQSSAPTSVGDYCFVGTACLLLKGSSLPDHSVLQAGSVLATAEVEPYRLYSGLPAKPVSELRGDLAYFKRAEGVVY
jgi:UDP-3-O-[3-hydroxymyristoyl] glucosamine N-acyltransferase